MLPNINTKKCTGCKEEKPIHEFVKDKHVKSGYDSRCKKCILKYNREWNKKNETHRKSQQKQYREEHKEYLRERRKKYYRKNRERIRHNQTVYTINNIVRLRDDRRKRQLSIKYNLSDEEYSKMFSEQGGICAICGNPETANRNGIVKQLTVDHNHITRQIRGLLCQKCNSAIGYLGEDIEIFRNAISYIEKWLAKQSAEGKDLDD